MKNLVVRGFGGGGTRILAKIVGKEWRAPLTTHSSSVPCLGERRLGPTAVPHGGADGAGAARAVRPGGGGAAEPARAKAGGAGLTRGMPPPSPRSPQNHFSS